MKILVLNPNTSTHMTDRMTAVGQTFAADGTELVGVTAKTGVPYISSRPEAQLAGAEVLTIIAEQQSDVDAVIIAAFGDPGLTAARDLFDLPVIGVSEAAMLTACMVGDRFALVTFSRNLQRWYEECVAAHGLGERFAGIHIPDVAFGSLKTVQDEISGALVDVANEAAASTGADSIILAGAPLAGLAPKIAGQIVRPAIDPISAAVGSAEMLVRLGGRSLAGPKLPSKTSEGLPSALADAIGG